MKAALSLQLMLSNFPLNSTKWIV